MVPNKLLRPENCNNHILRLTFFLTQQIGKDQAWPKESGALHHLSANTNAFSVSVSAAETKSQKRRVYWNFMESYRWDQVCQFVL